MGTPNAGKLLVQHSLLYVGDARADLVPCPIGKRPVVPRRKHGYDASNQHVEIRNAWYSVARRATASADRRVQVGGRLFFVPGPLASRENGFRIVNPSIVCPSCMSSE